ncbi:MAG: transketolase [Polyangiaceae bacterium]|nr:transketolase [Polyangiaceae bacterium]
MTDIHVQTSPAPLADEAASLRREVIEGLFACGGGHYGGSLSVLDLLLSLYRRALRVSPRDAAHPGRDRLILSKGHSAIALYAILRRLGFFDLPLGSHGRAGSPLEGHPDMLKLPGVDFSTGSLGQGLSVGLGMSLALRGTPARTWVVLGDGECQEGQVWEAAMLAARLRVDHLHAVIDANGFQEWGFCQDPGAGEPPVQEMARKWTAFGWRVDEVDGHDHEALAAAFVAAAATEGRPTVTIARTVKGKGSPVIEADPIRFHCTTVDRDEHASILRSLR